MYKFVAATLSFYPYSLEADYRAAGNWPEVGVDVSDYVYADYKLKPAPAGTQLGADPSGKPCWVPIPPPTQEEILVAIEAQRKALIAEVDSISVVAWNSMTTESQSDWVKYRKELVDLPNAKGYPDGVVWPVKPEIP